jgi:hypothetical protein
MSSSGDAEAALAHSARDSVTPAPAATAACLVITLRNIVSILLLNSGNQGVVLTGVSNKITKCLGHP